MKLPFLENKKNVLNLVLLGLLTTSIVTNQTVLANTKKIIGVNHGVLSSIGSIKLFSNTKLTGNLSEDATKISFKQGIPEKYGPELNVNFDQVQGAIDILKQYDPGYGRQKISLAGEEKQRYINVGRKISCEYCCGVDGIVFANGEAACGCAHSQAMRGLAAYLIKNHGPEYTDDQILRELAAWKGRYFPKQMVQKTMDQIQSGKYTPDIAALLLDVKLPKYGANDIKSPAPSDLENAPGMVGGC
ncbi:MAG: hypothetical protein G01um101413_527 [Parcubacteria group bacterium Gr01-1014_13]|nr:MAG: hypothetical protein G01um101413_527 [Parcubacteria group bacterium Gr01-1014_13]